MDIDQARAWMRYRGDDLGEFTDYIPELHDDARFEEILDGWFSSAAWREKGDAFSSLGETGDGTMFAAWKRPGSDQVGVVMFGSEGELKVLAASLEAWVKALAYGPDLETMDPEDNWIFDEEETPEALGIYADSVEETFGAIEPLATLLAGTEEPQQALREAMGALTGIDFSSS